MTEANPGGLDEAKAIAEAIGPNDEFTDHFYQQCPRCDIWVNIYMIHITLQDATGSFCPTCGTPSEPPTREKTT